uniref:Ras-related GTPase n=2 Tax=root TaxID=1 RepID=A0A481YYG1_9VIRU|nr:MAG: Ras-related GTPase [Marseillevirus LCMAC202]
MTDFKLTLYGEFGAGKTSLTNRLLHNNFNYSQSTIGASFMSWKPDLKHQDQSSRVNFGIWDTAGQERFSNLLPMYLRNADAVFYCWDYNTPFNRETANNMYTNAKEHSPNCLFYLVLTKIDKTKDDDIVKTDAELFAKDKEIDGIFYTSSLTGDGVQDLFIATARKLLSKLRAARFPNTIPINHRRISRDCCVII